MLQNNLFQNIVNYSVFYDIVAVVQVFWPINLLQNTVDCTVFWRYCSSYRSNLLQNTVHYCVFYLCFNNGLRNFFQNTVNYSVSFPCSSNGSSLLAHNLFKTLQITVFSTYAVTMVKASLPNNLLHPYWSNAASLPAKQFLPKRCNLQCFQTIL